MSKDKRSLEENLKYLKEYSSGINKDGIVEPLNIRYKSLKYQKTSKSRDKIGNIFLDVLNLLRSYRSTELFRDKYYNWAFFHFLGCSIRMHQFYPIKEGEFCTRHTYKKRYGLEIIVISDEHRNTDPIEEFFDWAYRIKFKKQNVDCNGRL